MDTSSTPPEADATDVRPKERPNGVEMSSLPATTVEPIPEGALAPSSAGDTAHLAGPIADPTPPPGSTINPINPAHVTADTAAPSGSMADNLPPPGQTADTFPPPGSTTDTAPLPELPADNANPTERDVGTAGPRASPALSLSKQSLGAHADAAIAAMEATVTTEATNGTEAAASDSGSAVHPLLVFINSKSGGRVGPSLLAGFQKLLGKSQVFDLSVNPPGPILATLLQRLDAQVNAGNAAAAATRTAMRILVCGGDGTVGWLLASLEALRLERPPPVAVVPLGTGNDLSRTFGWGGSFSLPRPPGLANYLQRVAQATPSLMDNWRVELFPADAAPLSLPHALHPHQLQPTSHPLSHHQGQTDVEGFRGGFWNYFSLGMDAHTAYAFHHLRERKPWLARGRKVNQGLYGYYGCAQGWFCLPCSCSPHDVSAVARIQYASKDGVWHPLELNSNVRAVVVLNLQSYAGGRDPWGHPSRSEQAKHGFVPATVDDGLLEVVAFTDGWHTAAVMAKAAHGRRLVQAHALVVELHGERAPRAYLQMDGEPWVQPCDPSKPPAVLHITHSGQSVVLATKGSKVRSSTLGQTVAQTAPGPPKPPAEVVERAKEGVQGAKARTGEVEMVQREEEAAVDRVKRTH
ncbi:diacylglycerol kinase [Klebsormidium nitens]|uniref:Diacylglycerol kinase n=1 Tax=Klebsormidium nitens TaxID=105231 RepID=A0A1Y1IDT0_KLENI|nr:diacylglycerol kinase [Klebsormidium nitens]|eukprot:GAQ89114.1 diacylglycerol kinase [Klebsormidium nitens]